MFVNKINKANKNKLVNKINKANKNKKGISELVSYVLLISLTVAIAAGVYIFVKSYAQNPLPSEECPEGINIILKDYTCDSVEKTITVTLENKGLFDITAINLKVINESNSRFEYDLIMILPTEKYMCEAGCRNCLNTEYCLAPGDTLEITGLDYSDFNEIKKLAIYPVKIVAGRPFVCTDSVIRVPVQDCNGGGE